jgi:all-trans-retinol 13,14-reductase
MNAQWDAIVIGAGLGGLGAAVTLAGAGKKVLVLEQSTKPGGYAQDFWVNGFRFDVSLHAMDGLAPGGWGDVAIKALGIADRLRFERIDPFYRAKLGGATLSAHADTLLLEQELIAKYPREKAGIRRLIDAMLQVFREMRRIREDTRHGPPEGNIAALFPLLVRSMNCTWDEFMSDYVADPELRALFSAEWTYYGLPGGKLSAATMAATWASYHFYGAWYPRGGVGAVVAALVERLNELGGELRCQARVTKIRVKDGIAEGVRLDDGSEISARVVISNASAPQTLLELVNEDDLPSGYRQRIRSAEPSLSTFNVYLGLNAPPEAFSASHELIICDEPDSNAQYAAIQAGDWDKVPFLAVNYGLVDPSCAPPGQAVITLMTLAPWQYRNVWETGGQLENYDANPAYQQLADQVADRLIDRAEQHIPGLRAAIRERVVATPVTNHRWTLNHQGAIFGTAQTTDNMYLGRLAPKTWIPNLVLTGAWTTPGGGQTAAMISGIHVGTRVIENLLKEEGVMTPPAPIERALDQPVPSFDLTSVHFGRRLTRESMLGRIQILLFHTRKTAPAAGALNKKLRERFPMAGQVGIANCVAMGNVPGLLRGFVRNLLAKMVRTSAASIPPALDAGDYLMILPDWGNRAAAAFEIAPTQLNNRVVAVVIDREGRIRHRLADASPESLVPIVEWM